MKGDLPYLTNDNEGKERREVKKWRSKYDLHPHAVLLVTVMPSAKQAHASGNGFLLSYFSQVTWTQRLPKLL